MKKLISLIAVITLLLVAIAPITVSEVVAADTLYKTSEKYGNVTYSIETYKSTYKYNKKEKCTYITSTMKWNWKKAPDTLKTDNVAMANGKGFSVHQNYKCKDDTCVPTNVATCKVTYKVHPSQSVDYSSAYKPRTVTYKVKTTNAGKGAYVNFPMQKKYKINGMNCIFYAQSGKMTVKWSKASSSVKEVNLSSMYGHTTRSIEPKVSIKSWDISYKNSVKHGAEAYLKLQGKPRTVK